MAEFLDNYIVHSAVTLRGGTTCRGALVLRRAVILHALLYTTISGSAR